MTLEGGIEGDESRTQDDTSQQVRQWRRTRLPETYGRWVALVGAALAWTSAVILAFFGHEWVAVVFTVVGGMAVAATSFYSRIRVISKHGVYLDPEVVEEIDEKVDRTVIVPEQRSALRSAALREVARDPELQASPTAADEAVRRAMRRRHAAEAELSDQRMAAAVADHLKARGYSIAQELTGDDYRVDLVATKDGERIVAELQLNVGWVSERRASEIVETLAPILVKFGTRDGIVVLPTSAIADEAARAVFENAGLRFWQVDPDSGEVTEP